MRRLFLASALLLSAAAHAQMSFNGFTSSGTGCPQNTVAFSPTPDGQGVSVLFDAFTVQVPQTDGINDNERPEARQGRRARGRKEPGLQHKICNLGFSVELEGEQMIEALEIAIHNRGATVLDEGVRAEHLVKFLGHRGLGQRLPAEGTGQQIEKLRWKKGPVNEDWVSTPVKVIPIRSGCSRRGGERTVNFQLRNHLEVEILGTRWEGKSGIVTMDSSDVNGSMKFRVITKPCRR